MKDRKIHGESNVWILKRTFKMQVEEKGVKVGLGKCTLLIKMEC